MKKIILVAIGGLLTTVGFSQVKIGGQVSGDLSAASFEIKTTQAITDLTRTPVAGFGAGVAAEVPLGGKFSLRPSLNLMHKGVSLKAKQTGTGGIGTMESEATNHFYYAELPVNFAYNMQMANSKFFVGVGPSVGYGLFGKSKSTYTFKAPNEPVETGSEKVDAFKKEDKGGAGFRRFDVGANAIAGLQWNSGLYVNASYTMAFTDALSEDRDSKYKNRGVQLTVGFLLGAKN